MHSTRFYLLIGFAFIFGSLSLARSRVQGIKKSLAPAPARVWMKCVAIANSVGSPGSGGTASSPEPTPSQPTSPENPTVANPSPSPTPSPAPGGAALAAVNEGAEPFGLRIEFALEPGNSNEISADTYEVDERGGTIKQIGHSELLSAVSTGNVYLQSAPDSPFAFSLTVEDLSQSSQSSSSSRASRLIGTIQNLALFTGEQLTQVPTECRLYSASDLAAGAAGSTGAIGSSGTAGSTDNNGAASSGGIEPPESGRGVEPPGSNEVPGTANGAQ